MEAIVYYDESAMDWVCEYETIDDDRRPDNHTVPIADDAVWDVLVPTLDIKTVYDVVIDDDCFGEALVRSITGINGRFE